VVSLDFPNSVAKGKLKEVKKLPRTIRGKGGFGSTGK